ncbi:hypothetical protein D3C73_1281210 [compost metagenome]
MLLLLLVDQNVGHAPALIKRYPCDDARMVIIPLHRLNPFLRDPCHIRPGELVGVRHLAPNQQAEPVRPVQITRIFDFLMLACTVKTHLLGQFHVPAQVVITRGGQDPLREVALVEYHFHEISPVIQQQLSVFNRYFSHSEIAAYRIGNYAVHAQGQFQIV